jgi:hypothetical protein
LETEGSASGVRARVTRSVGFHARQVILRMPRALQSVSIDGKVWRNFSGEEITLPDGESLDVVATFL